MNAWIIYVRNVMGNNLLCSRGGSDREATTCMIRQNTTRNGAELNLKER